MRRLLMMTGILALAALIAKEVPAMRRYLRIERM